MKGEPYPAWICSPCGIRHGKPSVRWSTWRKDNCGWCGEIASCTEPRDFGYPPQPLYDRNRLSPDNPSPENPQ